MAFFNPYDRSMARVTISAPAFDRKRMILLGVVLIIVALFVMLLRHQSPAEQAIGATEQIEAAALNGRGDEACAALTARAQQQLLAALVSTPYAARDCATAANAINQAVDARRGDVPSQVLYRMDPAEVIIRGNRATVQASTFPTPDGPQLEISLIRAGEEWKIDAITGDGIPE